VYIGKPFPVTRATRSDEQTDLSPLPTSDFLTSRS
jgi:hypothetical protein